MKYQKASLVRLGSFREVTRNGSTFPCFDIGGFMDYSRPTAS